MNRQIMAILFGILAVCVPQAAQCQDEAPAGAVEEKLYNFDDMLIDGAFRDPQGMFERARSEAQFEGVLNLQRSFVDRLESGAQETAMRP